MPRNPIATGAPALALAVLLIAGAIGPVQSRDAAPPSAVMSLDSPGPALSTPLEADESGVELAAPAARSAARARPAAGPASTALTPAIARRVARAMGIEGGDRSLGCTPPYGPW